MTVVVGAAVAADDPAGRAMQRVTVVSDSIQAAHVIAARVANRFRAYPVDVHELPAAAPGECTLVDISLRDPRHLSDLRQWLKRKPENGQVIFGVDRESHLQSVRAYAVGATGLLPRPIDGEMLARKLAERSEDASKGSGAITSDSASSVAAGASALENIFSAALSGGAPDLRAVDAAGNAVIASIEEEGLSRWLEVVRRHHSQTYQHCLIVTAVAVSFGQSLGFNSADQRRLAEAGLLHDIGKARIPLEILEKPARLSEEELAVMRQHPLYGLEALKDVPGLQPEMLDMVVHHHEYLDGSGYPHGLVAGDLSDLVRTITIADIYGALLERRPYKAPMSAGDAYQVLKDMGPRLDADLVREFRAVARIHD